jgi:hypothetical protein
MPKPAEYKHIRAWGHHMLSYAYYIRDQQQRASETNAPLNAIYENYADDGSGRTGTWSTVDDITNEDTRRRINEAAQKS